MYDTVQLLAEPEPDSTHVAELANVPPAEPSLHDIVPLGVVGVDDVSVIVALKVRLAPARADEGFGDTAAIVARQEAYAIGFCWIDPWLLKTAPQLLLNAPPFIMVAKMPTLLKTP